MTFSRRDGAALRRMRDAGFDDGGRHVFWVTNEPSASTAFLRAEQINVPCYHVRFGDRLEWIKQCATEMSLDLSQVCYVADSDDDAEALAAVGCGIAPSDAMPDALRAARYIVGPGGRHVAEQVEALLKGWEE